jgi:glycosyltransferase involved in cell wall biosynthesis
MSTPQRIRILAVMEAASVTGPAKNLIGFGRWLQTPEGADTGLGLTIATFDRNSRIDQPDSFANSARAAGIDTEVVHERYRFDLAARKRLRELIARVDPHIIQTHNNKSHLFIRLLASHRAGRAWFAFQHGDVFTDLKQRVYNHADRFSLRGADRVVTVCEAFAQRLLGYGIRRERLRVLHNSAMPLTLLPPSERTALRATHGIGAADVMILSVGRLSHEKGHADFLRALGLLRLQPSWRAVLVGTGPELGRLKAAAATAGVTDRVEFAGFRGDAARYFGAADVFVLPSHTEGSSNALLEAMVARVPIVATLAGGNPEIIVAGRTGLLVPVGDAQALAAAIARVVEDRQLASLLVQAAADRAATVFSPEQYRRQLCDFYQEALAGPSARAGAPMDSIAR